MAMNCWLVPSAIEGFPGVTAMETSETEAGVTVRVVFPLTVPEVAVIMVLPVVAVVARPALLMLATAMFDEPQETCDRGLLLPSL